MKKLMFIALTLAAGISFADGYSPSQVPSGATSPDVMPGMVNFQGLLRDPATGSPYADGIYTLECRLYTSISGTKAIWGAQYQAYVREGYFNIMLGSTGTTLGGCTYPNPTDLWKALWYNGSNRELYLGVTPWQGSDGQTIADADKRVEITPRQQLLAAPFALRAQKSQYADAAVTDFTVPGDLTVAGQIKNSDGSAFGLKNIAASDAKLELGTTSSPDRTLVRGKDVAITSGGMLNLNPGSELNVRLAAGKTMTVIGNNGDVSFYRLASFKAKANDVYLGWDHAVDEVSGVRITKNDDKITATASQVSMECRSIGGDTVTASMGVSNGLVAGKGSLAWVTSNGTFAKPFRVQKVQFALPSNWKDIYPTFSAINLSGDYVWSVVGYKIVKGNLSDTQWKSSEVKELYVNSELECLCIKMNETIQQERSFEVTLLGVNKAMCDVIQ